MILPSRLIFKILENTTKNKSQYWNLGGVEWQAKAKRFLTHSISLTADFYTWGQYYHDRWFHPFPYLYQGWTPNCVLFPISYHGSCCGLAHYLPNFCLDLDLYLRNDSLPDHDHMHTHILFLFPDHGCETDHALLTCHFDSDIALYHDHIPFLDLDPCPSQYSIENFLYQTLIFHL